MSSSSTDWLSQIFAGVVVLVLEFAQSQISALIGAFGSDTEPDFASVVAVYDVMLAISLLLAGAIIAAALLERVGGGGAGAGWNVLQRVVAAIFFAFFGIQLVQYLAHYAELMTSTWTQPSTAGAISLASLGIDTPDKALKFVVDNLGMLFLIGVASGVLSFVVYLELIVRGALILVVTAFLPLVAIMAIWPRLSSAATHLAEFLVGLLLSKFVLATAITIGFSLITRGMFISGSHVKTTTMLTGVAVLLIAAFSPIVLVQGLRFTHNTAGSLARGWIATGASAIPLAGAARLGARALSHPAVGSLRGRAAASVRARLPRKDLSS